MCVYTKVSYKLRRFSLVYIQLCHAPVPRPNRPHLRFVYSTQRRPVFSFAKPFVCVCVCVQPFHMCAYIQYERWPVTYLSHGPIDRILRFVYSTQRRPDLLFLGVCSLAICVPYIQLCHALVPQPHRTAFCDLCIARSAAPYSLSRGLVCVCVCACAWAAFLYVRIHTVRALAGYVPVPRPHRPHFAICV